MNKRYSTPISSIEFAIDETSATGILKIRGALTEEQVETMQQKLESSEQQISCFKINLENVTAVDLTSIEALYSACKNLRRSNKTMSLEGLCPVTFTSAVENVGLSNHKWLCFGQL